MSNPFDDLKEDDEETDETDSITETETEDGLDRPRNGPTRLPRSRRLLTQGRTASCLRNRQQTPSPLLRLLRMRPTNRKHPRKQDRHSNTAKSNRNRSTLAPRRSTSSRTRSERRSSRKLAEADVIDEETREIHDAVLRLANEEPERIAELVLEERRQTGE